VRQHDQRRNVIARLAFDLAAAFTRAFNDGDGIQARPVVPFSKPFDIVDDGGGSGFDPSIVSVDRLGPKVVALKLGKEGAYIATPDERRVVPGRVVKAVDATGAGDCFGGAFIARIVAGDDPFAAARYANVAAALSTQGFGAVAPIPDRATVEKALAE